MLSTQVDFFSRIVVGAEVGTMKRYLTFLILITAFATLGFYSPSASASDTSWKFACSSTILNHPFIDTVVQQMYLIPENEDSYGLDSKDSPDQGSVLVADSLNYLIPNSGSQTLLDSINSFHYVLNYGYSQLRSPPIFS